MRASYKTWGARSSAKRALNNQLIIPAKTIGAAKSSWSEVLLQAVGMHVTSVKNSLTRSPMPSRKHAAPLELQDGSAVFAGHSWSGTLVSDVGAYPKEGTQWLHALY
jgi:hypothetical protein